MIFSKTCEYGLKATLHIAHESQAGNRASLKKIATAIDSPEAFTAKILQQLVHHGILNSIKGPYGGFEISDEQRQKVKLVHIVKAIDGESVYKGCGLGLKECNERNPCPLHDKFKSVRNELKSMLDKTSIQEMIDKLNAGEAFLR